MATLYESPLLLNPLPATSLGTFPEVPSVFLPVTYPMLLHIRGLVERMEYGVAWEGSEEEVEEARLTIRRQAWAVTVTASDICDDEPDPSEFWTLPIDYFDEDAALSAVLVRGAWTPAYAFRHTNIMAGWAFHVIQGFSPGAWYYYIEVRGMYKRAATGLPRVDLFVNGFPRATLDLSEEEADGLIHPFTLVFESLEDVDRMESFAVTADMGFENDPDEVWFQLTGATLLGIGEPPLLPSGP